VRPVQPLATAQTVTAHCRRQMRTVPLRGSTVPLRGSWGCGPLRRRGLSVDRTMRRASVRCFGRRWSGLFVPRRRRRWFAGVREPRRPRSPAGSIAVAIDLAAG